jgi:hypothetical protein
MRKVRLDEVRASEVRGTKVTSGELSVIEVGVDKCYICEVRIGKVRFSKIHMAQICPGELCSIEIYNSHRPIMGWITCAYNGQGSLNIGERMVRGASRISMIANVCAQDRDDSGLIAGRVLHNAL